ncbi:hypothetical protein CHARACLAT_025750 [Characodon lateralis]|uniref:Uncharacterized protein n=1 Tax=Characodon lateralis TaxID=208331 RepID=A0ABU7EXB8_9TELE|nr:hypothetical protein [Characodon lateralis]
MYKPPSEKGPNSKRAKEKHSSEPGRNLYKNQVQTPSEAGTNLHQNHIQNSICTRSKSIRTRSNLSEPGRKLHQSQVQISFRIRGFLLSEPGPTFIRTRPKLNQNQEEFFIRTS